MISYLVGSEQTQRCRERGEAPRNTLMFSLRSIAIFEFLR
jgi:hypothetical protein